MLLISIHCEYKNDKRKIVVYYGCDNIEIIQDLDLSIIKNENLFSEMNIEIEKDTIEHICGYLLIKNNNKLRLESVLTDVDLMNTVKDFFN